MSIELKPILSPVVRERFEERARTMGYRDFSRRGHYYNVTDLNLIASGFMLACDEKPTAIAPVVETAEPSILQKLTPLPAEVALA